MRHRRVFVSQNGKDFAVHLIGAFRIPIPGALSVALKSASSNRLRGRRGWLSRCLIVRLEVGFFMLIGEVALFSTYVSVVVTVRTPCR
jgi:hypothetical protein